MSLIITPPWTQVPFTHGMLSFKRDNFLCSLNSVFRTFYINIETEYEPNVTKPDLYVWCCDTAMKIVVRNGKEDMEHIGSNGKHQ